MANVKCECGNVFNVRKGDRVALACVVDQFDGIGNALDLRNCWFTEDPK